MKKNKLITVVTVALLLIVSVSTAYYFTNIRCVLDGESVCYDNDTESFGIEEDAKLLVQVESEALGDFLLETWNKNHPDHKGAIQYEVHEALTLQELADGFPYDVMLTNQKNASYFINDLHELGKNMEEVVGSKIPSQLQDAINLQGYYFVQNSIDGWYFVYNETMLEEMGFNMESEREFALPDSLNSWEKIFENSDKILEKADYIFPLTFTDQNSFYPFLTGGHWTLNFSNVGSEPGFNSNEFNEGLKLIELFAENDFYRLEENEEKTALPWLYEEAFYNGKTPFTMLHSSMNFEEYKEVSEDVYKIAPFPTFQEHHLAPMSEINGYMVSNKQAFPSASAEVLRILRSPDAIKVYTNTDGKTPIYSRNHFDDLDLEDELLREILAFNYHDAASVLGLDNNPNVLSRKIYEDVDFMDIFQELYLKEISRDEAQEMVESRANKWLEEHDVGEE